MVIGLEVGGRQGLWGEGLGAACSLSHWRVPASIFPPGKWACVGGEDWEEGWLPLEP